MSLRGCRYHVRHWGNPTGRATPLVLAHGWMDVAASYQFMIDALSDAFVQQRPIIAFDWRGYGLTESTPTDSYWMPDYLGDLDALLDHFYPEQAIDLVGHSMGGNVVMMYTGARPERVRRLVNLEGFGLAVAKPSQAPGRMATWLDELKAQREGKNELKPYADAAGVAARLMKTNRRPYIYRVEETLETYKRITPPLLAVEASDDSLSQWWKGTYSLAEYHERLKSVPQVRLEVIQDAGHMMHHDQPQALADLLENFLA